MKLQYCEYYKVNFAWTCRVRDSVRSTFTRCTNTLLSN